MYVEQEEIFNKTDGGLDIILNLYPQAQESVKQRNRKFKIRDDEKTASCSLHYNKAEKVWLVTDFGGDQKARNGILCYMLERRVDFGTAIQELASQYGVVPLAEAAKLLRAEYSERPADDTDQEKTYSYNIAEGWSDAEIETVISRNVLAFLKWNGNDEQHKAAYSRIAAAFKKYNWHPLVSYSYVKNRKVMTFSSTEAYPIFLIDEGTHKKIYQPKSQDKGKRFMYDNSAGKKPKDFIHGLKQLEAEFQKRKELMDAEEMDAAEMGGEDGSKKKGKRKDSPKVDEVILVSGGSDAINVALLGYRVIWMNSETALMPLYQFNRISQMVETIYQLGDIDQTGLRATHELAMEYLDIHNIELPAALRSRRDPRGNSCKDLRDYLNHYNQHDFKKLFETALPYRFYEKKARFSGRGEDQIFIGYDYEFDNVQGYNFLQKNGFYRLPVGDKETDWQFIQITDNTVRKVTAEKIKGFFKNFLRHRSADKALKNAMFRTTQLSDSSLANLDEIEIDFSDATRDSQYVFFRNGTVEVTKEHVKLHKSGLAGRYSWEQDQMPHDFSVPDVEPFTITRDEFGNHDIQVNTDCFFMKYMVQTSRVHWRDELEGERIKALSPLDREKYLKLHAADIAGSNLSQEQQDEQKQHLINKIFAIGYLLHRHKVRNKAWFVWAQDNKINFDGQSHGGSGKSILFDLAMRHMMPNNFYINGRNAKLTDDPHKYDGLTEFHRYILVEDAHEFLRLDVFYNDVTGEIQVNPKGKQPYTIPFSQSGKFAFTTNYTARNLGPSTERRMIVTAFSDFYHNKGENDDYLEMRDPKTDLGITLFEDFSPGDWNNFYSTMLHCLKFYLGTEEKIKPAMENVTKRELLSVMGQNFHDWALAYFTEEEGAPNLNRLIIREVAFMDYKVATQNNRETSQRFMERLKAYCRYYGFALNPVSMLGKNGQIIRKVKQMNYDSRSNSWIEVEGKTVTKEHIYVQTENSTAAPAEEEAVQHDMPF